MHVDVVRIAHHDLHGLKLPSWAVSRCQKNRFNYEALPALPWKPFKKEVTSPDTKGDDV